MLLIFLRYNATVSKYMSGRLIAYEAKTAFELPAIVAPAVASAPQQQSSDGCGTCFSSCCFCTSAAAPSGGWGTCFSSWYSAPQQQSPMVFASPAAAVAASAPQQLSTVLAVSSASAAAAKV